jgi:glyoxylase-like metal-dependent hydrolase (beta-lactamase superfamily II)
VLVTHAHPDHASGAPALAAAWPSASFLKHPWSGEDTKYAVDWRPLKDGDRVEVGGITLTALHTAGHSPDHLVFWHEPSGTVFAGDLVIPERSVMIDTKHGGDLQQYLLSLERVRALEPVKLLPAHGREVADPGRVLRIHLDHRRMRERQVIAALRAERNSVQAIAESIYDGLDAQLMEAARKNVLAHLRKLMNDGVAIEQGGRWTLERKA